jgi:hypothetical protein
VGSAYNFLARLYALGGADRPEDICGAFRVALEQPWEARTRYAILIADAPCHGNTYHDLQDSFPEGDPHGSSIETLI